MDNQNDYMITLTLEDSDLDLIILVIEQHIEIITKNSLIKNQSAVLERLQQLHEIITDQRLNQLGLPPIQDDFFQEDRINTLRDAFAAQALNGLLFHIKPVNDLNPDRHRKIASDSYRIANAMLEVKSMIEENQKK